MANTKISLQSKKEKKNRPTTSKNRTSSEERWTPKEYIIAKVLPVTSVDCGSSTGEPAASRSPRISAARRRFFLRWPLQPLESTAESCPSPAPFAPAALPVLTEHLQHIWGNQIPYRLTARWHCAACHKNRNNSHESLFCKACFCKLPGH